MPRLPYLAHLRTRERSERLRITWFRLRGVPVGEHVRICTGVRSWEYRVEIGNDVFIGAYCLFEDHAPVRIGDRVWIAAGCKFMTATHEIGDPEQRAGEWRAEPIDVGEGTWLGANTTVLAGVTIGPGCVIAAGAVVTGDCEPNGLYAGIPARRKRDL